MVFKFHTAFALGLLAMVAGMYLIMKAKKDGACCKAFAKVVGWFVIITAFLGIVCSTYYSVLYMQAGLYCPTKAGWHGKHRGRGMKEGPFKKKMMDDDDDDE